MPDISMCPDDQCPQASTCYRSELSGTKPHGYMAEGAFHNWQSYFAESPRKGDECKYFWPSRT